MLTVDQLRAVVLKKGYQWFEDKPMIIGIRNQINTNKFDDECYIYWRSKLLFLTITTDPGTYYIKKPVNPKGCGLLVPGQYIDCWKAALHNNKYIGLVQVGLMKSYRDNDKTDTYDVDPKTIEAGYFGCNFHHAFNVEVKGNEYNVDNWSAMCQVVLHLNDFKEAMFMLLDYDNFLGKLYSYTLLEKSDL